MRFKHFILTEWITVPQDRRNEFITRFEQIKKSFTDGDSVNGEKSLHKLFQQLTTNLKLLYKQKESFMYDFNVEYNCCKELYISIYQFNKNTISSRLSIIPFDEFSKHYLI